MVLTASHMLPLGSQAPDFALPDVLHEHRLITRDQMVGPHGFVVMFWCNHCPYVQHLEQAVVLCAKAYQASFGWVAISANDAERYPEDGPEHMRKRGEEHGYPFPYL